MYVLYIFTINRGAHNFFHLVLGTCCEADYLFDLLIKVFMEPYYRQVLPALSGRIKDHLSFSSSCPCVCFIIDVARHCYIVASCCLESPSPHHHQPSVSKLQHAGGCCGNGRKALLGDCIKDCMWRKRACDNQLVS